MVVPQQECEHAQRRQAEGNGRQAWREDGREEGRQESREEAVVPPCSHGAARHRCAVGFVDQSEIGNGFRAMRSHLVAFDKASVR